MKTNLAPRPCKPFAFTWFFSGAIFSIFKFLFRVTILVRNFLHNIVIKSATKHFARLNAISTFCWTL